MRCLRAEARQIMIALRIQMQATTRTHFKWMSVTTATSKKIQGATPNMAAIVMPFSIARTH